MTICAAALAANSRAIVCVADKALSWGDYFTWESDSTKIIQLAHPGCVAMISGGEEGTTRVISSLLSHVDLGTTAGAIKTKCESDYTQCVEELINIKFLNPQLIDPKEYKKAVLAAPANSIIEGVSKEVRGFDVDCELIICGFDSKSKPFIFHQTNPSGSITDMTFTGFAAIGSGSMYTLTRLLFLTHRRDDSLEKVIYDTFDAKASAEMSPSVGTDWDTVIIYLDADNKPQIKIVDEKINKLIERAWYNLAALSPYEKRDKDDLKRPPRGWKATIKKYIESFMPSPTPKP